MRKFAIISLYTCADPGIFVRGGGPGQSDKKALTTFFFFFFSPQLILQKSNGQFQRNLSFFKVPEGVQHFPGGGSNFFPGGGSNCLFPIETHITCDFPGGSGPPVPPVDSHLIHQFKYEFWMPKRFVSFGVPNLSLDPPPPPPVFKYPMKIK